MRTLTRLAQKAQCLIASLCAVSVVGACGSEEETGEARTVPQNAIAKCLSKAGARFEDEKDDMRGYARDAERHNVVNPGIGFAGDRTISVLQRDEGRPGDPENNYRVFVARPLVPQRESESLEDIVRAVEGILREQSKDSFVAYLGAPSAKEITAAEACIGLGSGHGSGSSG
jgi:hypothetical protein